MSDTKSCFNCAHLKTWSYSATREDPGDEGWECKHPNGDSFPYEEPEQDVVDNDELFAEYCAKDCPGWEFKDWAEQEKQQAIAEAELEAHLAVAEKQLGIDQYFEEQQLMIDAQRPKFTESELEELAESHQRVLDYGFDFSWE